MKKDLEKEAKIKLLMEEKKLNKIKEEHRALTAEDLEKIAYEARHDNNLDEVYVSRSASQKLEKTAEKSVKRDERIAAFGKFKEAFAKNVKNVLSLGRGKEKEQTKSADLER